VGFEPGTQGSPDLCASSLTTAPRGQWNFRNMTELVFDILYFNKKVYLDAPIHKISLLINALMTGMILNSNEIDLDIAYFNTDALSSN
jgi:hypothetical protein